MNFKNTLWISHSALSAFSRCPHLYYLEYVYRNPKTGNRIQTVNPYFSLGLSVHETIEGLAETPKEERKKVSLKERFESIFENYRGKRGGFVSRKKEEDFFRRGVEMVKRVEKSGFLAKPSATISSNFPTVNLTGEEVKLVGSLDWIELLPEGGAHIIDFKTGNNKESNGSLQLPIYTILAKENLPMEVKKVSYWYLQHDDSPVAQEIGDIEKHRETIKEKAETIKNAIKEDHFPCRYNGKCFACGDYKRLFAGEGEMVGTDKERNKDLFIIFDRKEVAEKVLEEDFLEKEEKEIFRERTGSGDSGRTREEGKNKEVVYKIKEKLKANLSKGELKAIINLLREDGQNRGA